MLTNVIFFAFIILASFIITKYNFKCIWYEKYGIYCMTCGMTRAITSIKNLDFYNAFRYNELLFVLFVYGSILDIITSTNYIKTGLIKVEIKHIIAITIIGLSYMFIRNIPFFSFLTPPN